MDPFLMSTHPGLGTQWLCYSYLYRCVHVYGFYVNPECIHGRWYCIFELLVKYFDNRILLKTETNYTNFDQCLKFTGTKYCDCIDYLDATPNTSVYYLNLHSWWRNNPIKSVYKINKVMCINGLCMLCKLDCCSPLRNILT